MANNWIAQAAHPINQRKEVINVDYMVNEKHHIEFRRPMRPISNISRSIKGRA